MDSQEGHVHGLDLRGVADPCPNLCGGNLNISLERILVVTFVIDKLDSLNP